MSRVRECVECGHTLDGNAMLDGTLCEPCGLEYWDARWCNECNDYHESRLDGVSA